MSTIKIKQVKSKIRRPKDQKCTLEALGLKRIGHVVEHKKSPSIEGMIKKVKHLITIIEQIKMELSNLTPNKGSIKSKKKRIGRGQGSGKGGTATRGHKGAKSRSGYSRKLGFEGGQMPLQRRIPKFGFKNINRVEYQPVNLDALQSLVDNKKVKKKTIDINTLIENRLVGKNDLVKILGRGDLSSPIKVEAHKFSETAKKAIEKAGGEIKTI